MADSSSNSWDASESKIGQMEDSKEPKIAFDLFLMIMKKLVETRSLKTLLELSLTNKALGSFGLPILENYPRRTVWLAIRELSEGDNSAISILGAFLQKEQAQERLESEHEDLFELIQERGEERPNFDWHARPYRRSTEDGVGRWWIEKYFVVGELDGGNVWVRVKDFMSPCERYMDVKGAFASEEEARDLEIGSDFGESD